VNSIEDLQAKLENLKSNRPDGQPTPEIPKKSNGPDENQKPEPKLPQGTAGY
jgi:hypothetical protein